MGDGSILYKREEHISYITINRPEVKNCLDPEANRILRNIWTDFKNDPDAWVAIITGAGSEAFCAGADLKAVNRGLSANELSVPLGGLTRDMELYKPIIAAVNGMCLGGGLELMLCCDLRVASDNSKFGLPEVRWGMIPAAGGTQRLWRNIPAAWAMEIILLGNPIDAREAYRMGLVNRVVSQDSLMGVATELAKTLVSRGPLALRSIKEAVFQGMDRPLAEALEIESLLARVNRMTEDYREGPRAFIEKRKPDFKGC